ncbi:MAG: hypothetical protein ACT4NJ_06420 [Nitrosopumilaceae archaeon]
MSEIGKKISELQKKIVIIKKELSEINTLEQPLPEFINTTNLLRSNEYLQKSNEKKSQLLIAYEEYTNELENLVSNIAHIKGSIHNLKSRFKTCKKIKKKVRNKTAPRKKFRKRKLKPRRRKTRKR